jgi:hypothetical protein
MRDQIETFDQQCDELMDLLVDEELCDGMGGTLTGLTCDVHLYGDQVPRLTRIIKAGLKAEATATTTPALNTGAA